MFAWWLRVSRMTGAQALELTGLSKCRCKHGIAPELRVALKVKLVVGMELVLHLPF